jgi:hypothetical protein
MYRDAVTAAIEDDIDATIRYWIKNDVDPVGIASEMGFRVVGDCNPWTIIRHDMICRCRYNEGLLRGYKEDTCEPALH